MKTWLDAEKLNAPPSLADTMSAILHNEDRSKIANLKLTAKTLIFIQENQIRDLPALADKVSAMHRDFVATNEQIKKSERRLKTLDKHLEHSDYFKKYRSVKAQSDKLFAEYKTLSAQTGLFAKSKADKALTTAQEFYEAHHLELTLYESAEKYLRGVLQQRFDPKKLPIKTWSDERDTVKSELATLYQEYHALRDDVQVAETIKRFAVKLMIPDEPKAQNQNIAREEML